MSTEDGGKRDHLLSINFHPSDKIRALGVVNKVCGTIFPPLYIHHALHVVYTNIVVYARIFDTHAIIDDGAGKSFLLYFLI